DRSQRNRTVRNGSQRGTRYSSPGSYRRLISRGAAKSFELLTEFQRNRFRWVIRPTVLLSPLRSRQHCTIESSARPFSGETPASVGCGSENPDVSQKTGCILRNIGRWASTCCSELFQQSTLGLRR